MPNFSLTSASVFEILPRDKFYVPFWENSVWSLETLFLIIMQIRYNVYIFKTIIKITIWIFTIFGGIFMAKSALFLKLWYF